MNFKSMVLLAALAIAATVDAATTTVKQIDTIQNSTGGAALSVPSVGAAIVTDTATQTLTGKTMSGASNTFSAIPASAVSSGQVGVANGGTGAATLTTNGVVFGNGTSAVGITAAGSQYQVYQAGASGVPTVGALNLGQSAAVTGQLPVASGGTGLGTLTTGSVLVGAGTSSPTLVAPSTSGNVLTSNGSSWISSAAAAGGGTANVVGSVGSPQSISAATAIAITGQITNGMNLVFVSGNGGSVTVTATPSITACTAAGEELELVAGANNVVLQDQAGLAGSKLFLNGNLTLGQTAPASRTARFVCDAAAGNWIEVARY
jgi:hypothetical protein